MKILYLTQLLPYPLDTGGKIKTFKTIQALAKRHRVHLVCFAAHRKELKYKKELEKVCTRVKIFVWPLTREKFVNLKKEIFFNLFSLTPFIFYRYYCPAMAGYLKQLFEEERFDALHIDHLNLAQYLPGKKNCPWILEEHNLESQGKWTIARREKLPANLIFLWEAVRLWLKERVLLKKFDHLLAISAEDKRLIEKKGVSPGKISILPTPMKMKKLYQWGQKNILFIGLLSWWPNKDAINWFLEKIYPQLKKKIVGLKFLLVGEGLKPSLKERVKRDASMTLTGYVKNIKPYLKRAGVFVLPFRMGSGLRIKMLIAMAAGIPVVGTRKGFEGLIGKEKIKGLLIADNEKELVNYLVKVLKDKELAQVVSQKQLVLIRKYYSKKRQEKVLKDVYE